MQSVNHSLCLVSLLSLCLLKCLSIIVQKGSDSLYEKTNNTFSLHKVFKIIIDIHSSLLHFSFSPYFSLIWLLSKRIPVKTTFLKVFNDAWIIKLNRYFVSGSSASSCPCNEGRTPRFFTSSTPKYMLLTLHSPQGFGINYLSIYIHPKPTFPTHTSNADISKIIIALNIFSSLIFLSWWHYNPCTYITWKTENHSTFPIMLILFHKCFPKVPTFVFLQHAVCHSSIHITHLNFIHIIHISIT